jgi:hypothetical protein
MELTTWQRTMLEQAVGSVQGNVATVRTASQILDVLEMTDEEKEAVGLTDHPDGYKVWTDTEKTWDIELTDWQRKIARNAVEQFQGWQAANADQLFDLIEQLEEA